MTFNRSARELFDFMTRLMRAKKKMAQQEAEAAGVNSQTPELPSIPLSDSGEERAYYLLYLHIDYELFIHTALVY